MVEHWSLRPIITFSIAILTRAASTDNTVRETRRCRQLPTYIRAPVQVASSNEPETFQQTLEQVSCHASRYVQL